MIIYKITNKIDGMIYIGQTKRSLTTRWKQHCRCANGKLFCYKLQKAILEYGTENFTVEQIDVATTQEEADLKEIRWIAYYNSTANGYNVSPGGKTGGNRKKVKSVESGIVFDTMTEAGKRYGLSHSAIRWAVDKENRTAGGQHWVSV